MDILKKAVLLVAILSISVFMAGCGGEEATDDTVVAPSSGAAVESPAIDALDELKEKMEGAQEEEEEAQE